MPQNSQLEQSTGLAQVTVDQRALIDKMLARYSGEFTVFRELLQNSDDAESSGVEIRFKSAAHQRHAGQKNTDASALPDPEPTHITHWTVRNKGGRSFAEPEDWNRVTTIAAGNPDSRKIGAFGVGFYSVFSVTENPSISSGGYKMTFEWGDANQLCFRKDPLRSEGVSDPQNDGWTTTIELPLRKACSPPPILDLMRFLASSITFMVHLKMVEVFLDGHSIGSVVKSSVKSQNLNSPEHLKEFSNKEINMSVNEIQHHRIAIESKHMHTGRKTTEKVDVSMFTAKMKVTVKKEPLNELVRCMKKPPPSELEYSLVYTEKEHDQSSGSRSQENKPHECTSIFQGLRADLNGAKHTRVFIGQATSQTTGVGGHMASCFIPTVERELIDFSDASTAIYQWNTELLHVGGLLCRAVYDWELSNIQQLWEQGSPESRDQLNLHFLHVLQFFTFHGSTPSPKVAHSLADSFYKCTPLMLLSSVGVRGAPDIRNFDPAFTFLASLPMLSEHVTQNGGTAIASLSGPHKLRSVEPSDVRRSLQEHTLNQEQLVSCLRWWIGTPQRKDPTWTTANPLHSATLICSESGRELALSSVRRFIDSEGLGAYIPPDAPLPASLLPLTVYQHFSRIDLAGIGWQEFSVTHWLEYLSDPSIVLDPKYDFTRTTPGAEQVLDILSRLWPSLSEEVRRDSREVLKTKSCIPTIHGLRCPDCSYLLAANNNPFDNLELATVQFRSESLLNQGMKILLGFIGVRRNVPPEVLYDRISDGWDGSVYELIHYLVDKEIPPNEVDKLKTLPLFTKRARVQSATERPHYRADELYPPEDIFRQLQLPVINWDGGLQWSNESAEVQFLYDLGLRCFPPLEKIVELCHSLDASDIAFQYFYQNLGRYPDYKPDNFRHVEFIPAKNDVEGNCWKRLDDVCWDTRWMGLGFSVVAVLAADRKGIPFSKLGIQQHPPPTILLSQLRLQPRDQKTAPQWFECLADCISSFSEDDLGKLSEMRIVPKISSGDPQWVSPAQCYLAEPKDDFIRNLFIFVHFGENANRFLSACGSKQEPSVKDIVERLIDNPKTFFDLAGGDHGYLEKLRELATDISRTPNLNDTLEKMSSKPVLLGVQRKYEDQGRGNYELRKPGEIVIIDDTKNEELFSEVIWAVPKEDLEPFYVSLGCRKLSKVIKEEYEYYGKIDDPERCREVKDLVLQRLPIFLKRYNIQPKIPFDSFRDTFRVTVCDKLRISKTFTIGGNITKTQEVWAAPRRQDMQTVTELQISRHARRNMYDLSVSLCQMLFGTFKRQDTFALAAMLSDLDLLKDAGYVGQDPTQQVSNESKNGSDPITLGSSASHRGTSQPGSPRLNAFTSSHNPSHSAKGSLVPGSESSGMAKCVVGHSSKIIPQESIQTAVESAISACKSGTGVLPSRTGPSQSARYCDDQGSVGNLQSHRNIEGIEVHASVPEFDTFLTDKRDPLGRFISIITPIASGVFKLPMTSFHIFHDDPIGPIASNRGGSIYLNLQFFEKWHDADVESGNRVRAQSFWFFAVAHEIAHNIVMEHNSDHEFWFSAICEKYVGALWQIQRSETYQVELDRGGLSLPDLFRFICGFEVA